MLGIAGYIFVLILALLIQEMLDRTALNYPWVDRICILFSISVVAFIFMVIKPDSTLRNSDSSIYIFISVGGMIYFIIVRNWIFPVRARKHHNSRF